MKIANLDKKEVAAILQWYACRASLGAPGDDERKLFVRLNKSLRPKRDMEHAVELGRLIHSMSDQASPLWNVRTAMGAAQCTYSRARYYLVKLERTGQCVRVSKTIWKWVGQHVLPFKEAI